MPTTKIYIVNKVAEDFFSLKYSLRLEGDSKFLSCLLMIGLYLYYTQSRSFLSIPRTEDVNTLEENCYRVSIPDWVKDEIPKIAEQYGLSGAHGIQQVKIAFIRVGMKAFYNDPMKYISASLYSNQTYSVDIVDMFNIASEDKTFSELSKKYNLSKRVVESVLGGNKRMVLNKLKKARAGTTKVNFKKMSKVFLYDFDFREYELGELCSEGHAYKGSKYSLVDKHGICVECDKEKIPNKNNAMLVENNMKPVTGQILTNKKKEVSINQNDSDKHVLLDFVDPDTLEINQSPHEPRLTQKTLRAMWKNTVKAIKNGKHEYEQGGPCIYQHELVKGISWYYRTSAKPCVICQKISAAKSNKRKKQIPQVVNVDKNQEDKHEST